MARTPREAAGEPTRDKSSSKRTNYYAVMGIQDFAKGSIAKRAYHRLALEWHPDRQVHASETRKKEAEDVFKRINEAYAVLSDSVRRKEFDLALRSELLGMTGGTSQAPGANRGPSNARPTEKTSDKSSKGGEIRLLLCPECGIGAEVKAAKRGGASLQCRACATFFHEVYCAGCKDWGATKGRRGESTMRCGCGNIFCQSRCPSCSRWNTFNGEAQGGRTRSCGFCGCKFHEAFCPGCSGWGVWEGKKGCRSLSCDCESLFYEISCQSCGMWGSVKGRHADANNSLRCGTCGSESHEAFCPSCRQWDSFPGAKGESTLVCKSRMCRSGQGGKSAVKTRFFQVFCESCSCWRSVLGDKSAVGTATIRCEGCKSVFRGATCPACGNWDQLLLQEQNQKRRRPTRFRQKSSGPGGSDECPADRRDEEREKPSLETRPECTSCGHQPPLSPDGDGPVVDGASSSTGMSLTGVAHEGAEVVGPAVPESASAAATAAALSSVGGTSGATVMAAQTCTTDVGSKSRGPKKSGKRKTAVKSDPGGIDQEQGQRQKEGSGENEPAPIHGMSANPPSALQGRKPPEDVSTAGGKFLDNDTATMDIAQRIETSGAAVMDDGAIIATESSRRGGEKSGGKAARENETGPFSVAPRFTAAGPNPHTDGEAPLPSVPVSPARTAAARAAQPPPRSRSKTRKLKGRRPSIRCRRPATSFSSTSSETGEPLGPESSAMSTTGASARARVEIPALDRGDGERGADRDRGGGSAEAGAAAAAPSVTPSSSPAAGVPGDTTFTAVPRESSPPPPPGMRIGVNQDQHEEGSSKGSRRDTQAARGQGQEVVHLAFCSRCQEYQSWKAALRGSGCWRKRKGDSDSGARRHCTECGDPYCNISYYPVR